MNASKLRLTLLSLLALSLAPAQDQSVKPGINDKFLDPELKVEDWTSKFETESREVFDQRARIVEEASLKPGMVVADIGAGTGLFTLPFSQAVGDTGKVYAVDIAKNFLAHIRARATQAKAPNIEPVLCTEKSVELPENSIDLAFICDTYHHFEYPTHSLESLYRAVRPGGALVLIEFHRIPGVTSDFLLEHVRAGQDVFTREIEAAGFVLDRELPLDGLEDNYVLRFVRPE